MRQDRRTVEHDSMLWVDALFYFQQQTIEAGYSSIAVAVVVRVKSPRPLQADGGRSVFWIYPPYPFRPKLRPFIFMLFGIDE